jgi:uncharacterized protein involved in exopolysaccharide biosynthesis/Mrp family chromosome partitioning ATPase
VATTDLQSLPGRGIKPLVSLLAHRRLALIVFFIVLIGGLPLVFIKGQPMYATTATVQVSPRYMKNLRDDGELSFPSNTQYREFLEHQTRSVLRYDIVQDALRSLGDRAALWRLPAESERLAIDRLRTRMSARSIPDTYMIEISLQATQREGLADLVNAVTRVYLERMKSERLYGADTRQRTLEEREQQLAGQIAERMRQRSELALQLGIATFGEQVDNPYDAILRAQRSALADARNKRFEAEARLKAFQSRGETDITTRSVQEAVLIDPGLASLKSNLYKRRADLLTQLAGLTPDHPAHADVTAEMARIEREIEAQVGSLSKSVTTSLLARYQTTVDQTRQVEADLTRTFAELEQQGERFARLFNAAMTLTHDLDQDRKELDAVRERLNEFAGEQNSFGFVRLVTPALEPELPFGPGKKKLLAMLLLAALAAAVAAPTVRDLLDRRIHTVNDAERVLGVPALGWLVEQDDAATTAFAEDQLRRMAGALIREQDTQGTRVVAFSAVKPGAGASRLVVDLAKTLSLLGYPALAVEANALKPDAAQFAAPADEPGLRRRLAGQDVRAPAADPTRLPARIPVDAAGGGGDRRHLDHLDRLPALTRAWAADYRFVLVDLPPLLLSADAEILARSLEHLILVVEAAGVTRGELSRAGRQLEKIDPAAVGVVVNRVRPFAGGGYLKDALIEFLTARKSAQYYSRPGWLTALHAWVASRRHLRFRTSAKAPT